MNPVLEALAEVGKLGLPVLVLVINAPPERRQRAPAARKPSVGAFDPDIAQWLEGKAPKTRYRGLAKEARAPDGRVLHCTVAQVLKGALGLSGDAASRAMRTQVGAALGRLRWRQSRPQIGGSRVHRWSRP